MKRNSASNPAPKSGAGRNRQLARLHCLKRDLHFSEEDYRAMLVNSFNVDSAGKLDARLLAGLVKSLERSARQRASKPYPGRPRNMDAGERAAQLSKVEALLAEAARPWAYADGIARAMFGVEKVSWCDSDHLRGVITALVKDAKRHGRRTE